MESISRSVAGEPQHLRALEHANRVRLARAELKRRIAAGDVMVPDVVLESPWEAQSMALAAMLSAPPSERRAQAAAQPLALGAVAAA